MLGRIAAMCLAAAVSAGCETMTSQELVRVAGDAGSTLSAAATTLRLVHEGRLAREYGRSSFMVYAEAIDGVDEDIVAAAEDPSDPAVTAAAEAYRAARPALEAPCLDDGCDWQSQEADIIAAARGFLDLEDAR